MTWISGKYPKYIPGITAILMILLLETGCGVGKTVPAGQHLLKKNSVQVRGRIPKGEISAQILHRANKRVLFNKVPIYLWAYAVGTRHRHPDLSDSVGWRRSLRQKLGEPPVILDTALVQITENNIRNYLFNKGYFDAEVASEIKYTRKKSRVKYHITPQKAYLINSVFMHAADTTLQDTMWKIANKSEYFRLWWPIDLNKLSDARDYMASALRNMGYYTVSNESFRFEVDTNQTKKEGAITMFLLNPTTGLHKKYHFGKVRVVFETSEVYKRTKNPDFVYLDGKHLQLNQYPLNPTTLVKLISFDSAAVFSQNAADLTFKSLIQTGLFSLVDIRYTNDTTNKILDVTIDVKTTKRMNVMIEPQGLYSPQGTSGTNFQTTSQRSFGVAGILSFSNKNLDRDAENLRISSITSYEAIIRRDNRSNPLFGLQQGFNISLTLPHFQLLDVVLKNRITAQRNTVFNLSYQFENNPNFFRSALPASISFQFVKPNFSWYYTPTEISFNRNQLSTDYASSLGEADSIFISRVFTNQFVSAAKLGFIYANNRNKPGETYVLTRGAFETSGNLHHAIRRLQKGYNPDSVYSMFGLQYFQYAKIEGEIRLRQNLDALNSIAMRVNSGISIPYGNSAFVPYDKRYFIGGSQSLRAWRPRRLGPGSTPDTANLIIDRSGEFLFEGNIEYRFTVIKNLMESALFVDIGNIWNLNRPSQTAPEASLLLRTKFFDDLALNTGIGFRFDFTFFLFRIDWGLPLRDPSKALGSRWLTTREYLTRPGNYIAKETALAFGIGYPF